MTLTTTANGLEYSKYLWGQTVKTAQANVPTTLKFALVPLDAIFIKLRRGNYITFQTTTYPYFFTGYIYNDPTLEYLGTSNGSPVWGYHYTATDDAYVLNLNPLGIMPPFVNTTQGAILAALAARIAPGMFNTSAVQDGEPIARYVVNPNDRFSDVVKAFADAAYYQFTANNAALTFAPMESVTAGLVIDGNDVNFTPARLKLTPTLNSKIYNDVIVIGDLEPQNKVVEYYVGDGYTATLPLLAAPYGVDRTVLLQDNFSNSSFDTNVWTVYDSANQDIQLYNGYLNTIGGPNDNNYAEYLTSANLVPLEGHLRFTHGEYDFVLPSSGVICGIWTGAPALTNQVATPSAPTLSTSAAGTAVTDYVKITLVDANGNETAASTEASIQSATTHQTTVTSPSATANAVSYNVYASTTSGSETLQATVTIGTNYTQPNTGWTTTGSAAPVANLTGTYTGCLFGILCSKNGTQTQLNPIYNGVADAASQVLTQYNNRYVFRTLQSLTNPYRYTNGRVFLNSSGNVSRPIVASPTDVATYQTFLTSLNFAPPAPTLSYVSGGSLPQTTYYVRQSYVTSVGETAASNEAYITVPANNLLVVAAPPAQTSATGWNCYVGTQYGGETLQNNGTVAMGTQFTEGVGGLQNGAIPPASAIGAVVNETIWRGTVDIPSGTDFVYYTPVALNDLHVTVYGITIDQPMQIDLQIKPDGGTAYYSKLVGPNELDSLDGMAPYATVTDQQGRKQTVSSTLGSKQYNPGQSTLAFFKDSTNQTTQVPQPGDIVQIGYHAAGAAIARVQDRASIASEAAAWGDSGLRSTTQTQFQPLPRSTNEAQQAGAAFLQDNDYQKYDGSYTCYNGYSVTAELKPGTILRFQNLPSTFPSITAEIVSQVQTTVLHDRPDEIFQFDIKFGAPDLTRKLLAQFQIPSDVFYPYDDAVVYTWVNYDAVGTTYVSDLESVTLSSYDTNNLYYSTNQTAPTNGGFEVRYNDSGWGCDDGSNLVGRFANETLAVPRTIRGRVVWVRQYDARNQILWSEDLTQSVWKLSATAPTVTNATEDDPYNDKASITTVTFPATAGTDIYQPVANGTQCAVNGTAALNCWVKGPKGSTMYVILGGSTGNDAAGQITVTFTGNWQYVTLGRTFTSNDTGTVQVAFRATDTSAPAVKISRVMVELGTTTPTIYCKTRNTAYGATSQFSTALHCAFPFVPPEPTASISVADVLHPVITVNLPGPQTDNSATGIAGLNNAGPSLADVWGYEIRASDNSTVLQKVDLVNTSNTLAYTYDNSSSPSRSLSFYVYFYNLLGEYSTGYNLTWSVAAPSVTGVSVNEATQKLEWTTTSTGLGHYMSLVEIDGTSDLFQNDIVNTKIPLPKISAAIGIPGVSEYALSQKDFFDQRWMRVTPYDLLGAGTPVVISHVYTPAAVVEFGTNEVYVITPS